MNLNAVIPAPIVVNNGIKEQWEKWKWTSTPNASSPVILKKIQLLDLPPTVNFSAFFKEIERTTLICDYF